VDIFASPELVADSPSWYPKNGPALMKMRISPERK
jgi:hypothetical protein